MTAPDANGALGMVGYVLAWVWACSPWFRFLVLPGLTPHGDIPLWVWPWE